MPKGSPKKKYTGEFKQKMVEIMIREGMNRKETAHQY